MPVDYGSYESAGFLGRRRTICGDVCQQANCFSPCRVSDLEVFKETLFGVAGGSAKGVGDFFWDDDAVLYLADGNRPVPHQYRQSA